VSSNQRINVQLYKILCSSLYADLIVTFPWVQIRPYVHKLLAHSWELIENNEGRGLRNLDESSLEGNNKVLRSVR
jgi:hypothetical protein